MVVEPKRRFVPKWRDAMGNVIVLAYLDTHFATEKGAFAWATVKGWPLMIHGFKYVGALEIEITLDNKFVIEHVPCTLFDDQFEALLIAGPLFDAAPKVERKDH